VIKYISSYFNGDVPKRLPQLFSGLILCGVGLALAYEANLGLNPWDVFHDGLSKILDIPIGRAGVLTGLIVLIAWIPLRQKPFIGTIINIFTIGNTQDVAIYLIPSPQSLFIRHIYLYIATMIFAIGVGLYIGAGLGPGPRDGIMTGLARLGLSIRAARIGIDFTAFFIGVLMGGSYGYGTLVMVIAVGPIVQNTLRKFDKGALYSL
jgi:uncharacterized membrane protein YczE